MTIVNAIITVGNGIRAALSKSADTPSSDALNKSVDALKEALLPHWAEETDKRAQEARAKLLEEMNRGPLKVQVMGKEKKSKRR
jgi:hypothetical protein